MSKAIEKIKTKAEELAEVRRLIHEIEDVAKEKLEKLKAQREALQTELILGFDKEGLSSIKTDDGDTYTKAVRKGVEVTNERLALAYAIEHRTVSINKVLLKSHLEPVLASGKKLPDGFEYKEIEYISIRSPKPKKGEGDAEKK